MLHALEKPVILEAEADPRCAKPSTTELRRADRLNYFHGFPRCIGGDGGDLLFSGYRVELGKTILNNAHVISGIADETWTEDDWQNLAQEILSAALASIGVECVEHS